VDIKPDPPDKTTPDAFGEIAFLAGRSPTHATIPMAALRAWWEMPIALKQHWTFRVEGVPRLALSWAALSPEAERRYVVERKGLEPKDWRSGPQIWVIDWIAPFRSPNSTRMFDAGSRQTGSKRPNPCVSCARVAISKRGRSSKSNAQGPTPSTGAY
jgi:hemolysin-activating ACP:hemolysin acyltransferase